MSDDRSAAQVAFAAMKARTDGLDDDGLALLFRDARTVNGWLDREVPDDLLRRVFDLAKMPPTSGNCSPARFVFVRSAEAKERLRPALDAGNVEKTMAAPACTIVAYDMEFYEKLTFLFPHTDARSWFAGKPDHIAKTAVRNGTLQGAYLILAARALGLDCGPMSGFDNDAVDAAFFADTTFKSNFLCTLGYGDPASVRPRSPRFAFDDACEIV